MKNNLKNSSPLKTSPNLNLAQFNDYILKRKIKKIDDSGLGNDQSNFSSPVKFTLLETEIDPNLINFTTPSSKTGSGLYKQVIPKTQIVYYDDPNELVQDSIF